MLPESIRCLLGSRVGQHDDVGRSGASVICFDDCVLKIQKDDRSAQNEANMTAWLKGRLPVPEILAMEVQEGMRYLLLSRLPGRMLCDPAHLEDQPRLRRLMAEALEMLAAVDISTCPTDRSLTARLAEAEATVAKGSLTPETCDQPDVFATGEFRDLPQLLSFLQANRPPERRGLIHGDFCLPNLFADEKGITGLLDLGLAGIADPMVDVEMGLWSAWANTTGVFGGKARPFDRAAFLREFGFEKEPEALRYYSLLNILA